MAKWRRRIRAAIGMGLTWALAWFGAGMILLVIVGFGAADVPFPLGFGMFGFFAGAIFSVVVGIAESRRGFEQMSLPRFAAWGSVAGVLLSVLFASVAALGGETTPLEHLVVLAPVFGLSGAVCAAGSLALARKAEDRELLGAGADLPRMGNTGDEEQDLPRGRG